MLDVWFASIPFVVCGLAFHFLRAVVRSAKVFNFSEVTFILIFFLLWIRFLVLYLRTLCPTQGHCKFLLCFLAEFCILTRMVWCRIHFKLNVARGM